jgi:glycosyltransferase involved in cell wall biosynthesis
MRVLHAILSEGFYGSERSCIELAAEQARAGHDVEVVIVNEQSDCAREMRLAEAGALGTGTRLRLAVIPGWAPAISHRLFARRAIARFRPDIVHTHLSPAARRVGTIAQKFRIPHISTLHINYDRREHDPCDGLVAVAGWQLDSAPQQFRSKIRHVRGWIPRQMEIALARAGGDDATALRSQWKAGDSDMVFGSVGRMAPEKGMDVLVAAFRSAFPIGNEPVRLVLVGGGPERDAVQRRADGDPRIIVAGAQSDVARYYRAFDVFVSAARFEPFGIAILEAMAAGLPLVVTRTQGPGEFVTDTRAIWAEPGDEVSLAGALREEAARGRRRLQYELGTFAVERAASEIEQFYREIAARSGSHIA